MQAAAIHCLSGLAAGWHSMVPKIGMAVYYGNSQGGFADGWTPGCRDRKERA